MKKAQDLEKEDAQIVVTAREPVRMAVFASVFGLVVVSALVMALFYSVLGGVVFALAAAAGLTVIYNLTARTPEALSSANTAGGTSCPECGSMQTDQDYTRGREGTEVLRWTCYACDHRWLA